MAYRTKSEQDSLWELMERLGHYRRYESFSSTLNHPQGHIYDDILAPAARTASGLIYDAVATTARLGSAERRKHKYAQEVLAAFCIHYCVVALSDPSKYCHVGAGVALDISKMVYTGTITYLKKRISEGKPIINLRRCLVSWARQKNINIIEEKYQKDSETGKWHPKSVETVSLEEENEDAKIQMRTEVVEYIMQKAKENMAKEDLIADMEDLLDECRSQKILTREDIDIICYSFGFGDGYEPLNTLGIAKKIGHDSRYVTNHLKLALERLRQFIMQEDNYKHLRRLI